MLQIEKFQKTKGLSEEVKNGPTLASKSYIKYAKLFTDSFDGYFLKRFLNCQIIRECCTLVNERNKIEHLMEQCEIISRDIQGLFAVKPSGSEVYNNLLIININVNQFVLLQAVTCT